MVWTDPDDFPGANRQRDGRYGFEPSRPGGKNYVGDLSTNRSKVLWEITLNDGDHNENAGFYWSDTPDPVNEEALRLWRRLGDQEWCEKKANPGQPYSGSAFTDEGHMNMEVKAVKHALDGGVPGTTGKYGIQLLKRLLKSRGIKYTKEDTKEALAIDLYAQVEEWIPVHEQGLEEKENEDGAPSTSEVTMAGEAGSANDETTEKRVADAPPAGAPSGKATRVDGVRKGPAAEQREHTGAMDTATLVVNPLAAWVERLARGPSRLRPKEPAASGSA